MTRAPAWTDDAWISTIPAGVRDTFVTHPCETIRPTPISGSRQKALAMLATLSPGPSIELRGGRRIGEGGMGIIHEAEQVALGRVVAVKTLKPGRTDPVAAQDLLREAWVTGALEHPNIVPIHHLEIAETGTPVLVMKRVDGVEWSVLLADREEVGRRFGTTDLLAWNVGILGQVLHALRFAHSRGVIHRDLKPSNVMIGNFGEVYLLDWGIAVSLRDDETGRFPLAAEATEIAGTPAYMAPEMLGRDLDLPLSERTDVYLAGAVLHELIVGHPPHRGASVAAIIASIVESEPEIPSGVPAELGQICRRALRQAPADRHASIEELQLALQGYLEHRGSAGIAARASERLAELLVVVAEARAEPAWREEIYRHLAICRFGFHEALAVWRDNPEARDGLTRATIAVAEYELASGDPRAAVTLLTELDERPALLATAQAAVRSSAERVEHLEKLHAEHDPTIGNRGRWVLGIGVGLAFTVLPLLSAVDSERLALRTHAHQFVFAMSSFIVLVAIGAWWRTRTPMTALNRLVFTSASYLFLCQALLAVGAWYLGIPIDRLQVLSLFLYVVVAGMIAIAVDRYVAVSAVGYAVGFLIAARWPATRLFVVSGSNLVLLLTILIRWRPASQQLGGSSRDAS